MYILYFYNTFFLSITIQLDDFVPNVILAYISAYYFNMQFSYLFFTLN